MTDAAMTDPLSPVTVHQHGRVLLATMDDGRANAMSRALSGALRAVLTRAEQDPEIGAVVIAAERLSRRHLQASVANAQLYNGAGAVAAGFLDAVVEPDAVLAAAMDHAAVLAELDPAAYAATVKALRGRTLARMAAM